MIRKMFSLLVLSVIIIALSSCENCIEGKGEIVSEVRDLEDFSQIKINVPADVLIHIGEFPKASIQTHENIIGKIKTRIKGKTLIIEANPCINNLEKLRIDLVIKELNGISLNGSGTVKTKTQIKTNDFKAEVNGSGNLSIDLFANSVKANINGSGNMIINGTTKDLDIRINGSGDFKGLGLQAYETSVEVNGSGNAKINTKNRLDVEIKGSGTITYKGDPKIKSDIIGSGELKKIE